MSSLSLSQNWRNKWIIYLLIPMTKDKKIDERQLVKGEKGGILED